MLGVEPKTPRTVASLGAVAALILVFSPGCTIAAPSPQAPLLSGWVQGRGEVHIYPNQKDLGELYTEKCITGFYQDLHTMLPSELENRRVHVFGHFISLDELHDLKARGAALGVENYCGRDKLVVIDRIVAW